MKYPCLVPKRLCRARVTVTIHGEGISEDGEPMAAFSQTLSCNYQDTAKTVLTDEKKLVQLSGVALFPGDICPGLAALSGGTVKVEGEEREIFQGRKARNPDGTVNYTELRLI
ncbi:hypothetical protein D3Z38_18305 [Clostridiales bacterium]|nr:hypothetical protein [Clostridiales bacterium]